MLHIKKELPHTPYRSSVFDFYFKDQTLGVLDIETTGLNPARSKFILGCLMLVSRDSSVLHQFFAEDLSQEEETLSAFLKEVGKADFLLTYNGKHFDLPFIQKRSRFQCSDLPYNLDLYLVLNGHSAIKPFLPNLKQKTVENFMGLWTDRKDEISGKESIDLYYSWLQTGDTAARNKILLHNSDDVQQLYRLLPILQKADLHKAMYHLGFPAEIRRLPDLHCEVNQIAVSGSRLQFSGLQKGDAVNYMIYEDADHPFRLTFDRSDKTFSGSLPLIRHSGLAVADAAAMGLDVSAFEKYPNYSQGLLVLENRSEKNYLEINHVIKQLLERI